MLPAEITALLGRHGVFTGRDAEVMGINAARIGRGAYAAKDQLDAADPWEKLAMRARASEGLCRVPCRQQGVHRGGLRPDSNLRGIEQTEQVVRCADGRSESVLETLGRLACIEHGVPVPISNAWVGRRHPEVRVDHLWREHWVVAEADGALKYRDQDDPAAVVAAEKEREWYLERELGFTVIRYGWDLGFSDRAELAGRFRAVLADHPPRAVPAAWWPDYDLLAEPIVD